MAIKLTFEMQGAGNLIRSFGSLSNDISNFQPFMKEALDVIDKSKDENFKTKWSNLNNKRAWLSPTTLKARKNRSWYYKQAPNNPSTLRWTWRLQENTKQTPEKSVWIYEFLQDYAKYHQTGSWKMKRPLFEFTSKVNAEISRKMQEFLNNNIKKNWF